MTDNLKVWGLIPQLDDENEETRLAAREEIVRMGQDAVTVLAHAVGAELISEETQAWAREVLAGIKPRFAGEMPDALIEAALATESVEICDAVSRAIVNFGAAASAPLLALLTRGDKRIYPSLSRALARIAMVDPSVMPAVIEAMGDENWNVRDGAAEVLFDADPPPVEAIAPLIRSLKEEDRYHRVHIISTLEQFGATAIPALIESLRSDDWRMRVGSAEALRMLETVRKIRSESEPYFDMGVVPALVEALGDENVEVLRAAGDALGTIGLPESNAAIPLLLEILRARNPLRFVAAAAEMVWIPYSEPGLEPELIDALADRDAGIRAAAAELLRQLAFLDGTRFLPGQAPAPSETPVPALLRTLEDEVEEVRFRAARALAEIAPAVSARGIPILHGVLVKGADREHMNGAMWALARYGPGAAPAIPVLIDALGDYWLAANAAHALKQIGPLAISAAPALLRALQMRDEEIRYETVQALAAIGPEFASAAVTVLLDQLRQPDEFNRCCAADCLGIVGLPAAKVAVPALLELMAGASECTRSHVEIALKDLSCDPQAD